MFFIIQAIYLEMLKIIKNILSEPLIHFLFLGALFYIYYASVSKTPKSDKEQIEISKLERKSIENSYRNEHDKNISKELLELYVQERFHTKVLLQEAYRLKLDESDREIVTKLVKKMEFLLQNSVPYVEPTQEELRAYYDKNREEYAEVKSLSFSDVYFERATEEELENLYTMLHTLDVKESQAGSFGDANESINFVDDIGVKELEERFGKYFTFKVVNYKKGVWQKPLHSKLGKHIVYVREKNVGAIYPFDEVEDRVYRDYLQERKEKIVKESYKNILQNYDLVLEK